MKGFANDDHELAAALTMLEIKGGAFCFVPHSAGGSFGEGYYHVFYRTTNKHRQWPTDAKSAMVRKAQEVYNILERMENGGPE